MLSKLGVFMSTQEMRTIYNHFDSNQDGVVNCEEIISVLRVSPKPSLTLFRLTSRTTDFRRSNKLTLTFSTGFNRTLCTILSASSTPVLTQGARAAKSQLTSSVKSSLKVSSVTVPRMAK